MKTTNNNKTGPRTSHAPDPYLMNWTAANLPNSQSYFITDVDMIVRDRKGNLLIIEIKRRAALVDKHQRTTYELLHQLIKDGIRANPKGIVIPSMRFPVRLKYWGFHVLQFENTTFEDGQIFWDSTPITPADLAQILSFERSPYI